MNKWKAFGLTAALAATVGLVGGAVISSADTSQSIVSDSQEDTENISSGVSAIEKILETSGTTGVVLGAQTDDSSSSESTDSSDASDSTSEDMTVQEVAAECMPSMVAITNTSVSSLEDYFDNYYNYGYGYFGFGNPGNGGQTAESVSMGTGVIVGENDDNILIATNAHVISGATTLTVAFADEDSTAADAEIIGSDSTADLAVISVAKSDLSDDALSQIKIITLGSSGDLAVGQQVVAIGNALGYGQSVSAGIVSALNRTITTEDETTGQTVETTGMIQTDASINPGNSGGALLNMKGELIGINSAKYADEDVEGMGYAIPIDYALPILTDLANGTSTAADDGSGNATQTNGGDAYLGVIVMTVSDQTASTYNVPAGAYVYEVEKNGAAENAGIEVGDIITAVDDTEVASADELKSALSNYNSGDTATITLYRQVESTDSSTDSDDENGSGNGGGNYSFGNRNATQNAFGGWGNGIGGFSNRDDSDDDDSASVEYQEMTVEVTFGSSSANT